MDQAIEQGIILTLLKDPNCLGGKRFEEYQALPPDERKKCAPKLICFFDMSWNQRSFGGRYSSPSGHAFLIGTKTQKSS